MDQERDEVYERIPWEALEKQGRDRQWMIYALAGAVVLGAIAYSFMRNQPAAPAPPAAVATTVPAATVTSTPPVTTSTVASPLVVAEADLYAIEPERLVDEAAGHAEWFAVEYISRDGSRQSDDVLTDLLPQGIPLPEAPEGTQVFVDWARAISVSQIGPSSFDVGVLVRSLAAAEDEGFTRQAPRLVLVEIQITEDGLARVSGVPRIGVVETAETAPLPVKELPPDLVEGLDVAAESVIGGLETPDGWLAVVMTEGDDGVRRPIGLTP